MIIFKFVKKTTKKQFFLFSFLLVVAVLIFLIGFSALGLYVFKWENTSFSHLMSNIIPFPILKINKDYIRFSDYQKDVKTLIMFYNQEANLGGLPVPSREIIEENVIERLKRNKIIEQLAENEGIQISKDELNREFYKMTARAGSPEETEKLLEDLYGWNENEFKQRIIKNILLQKKLKEKLGLNVDLDIRISEELERAEIKEYIK